MTHPGVRTLQPATVAPDPELIKLLEGLLDLAKSGELRDGSFVGNLTGNRFHCAHHTHDTTMLVGQISIALQHVLTRSFACDC